MNKKITVNLAVAIAIIAMTVTFSVTMLLSMKMFDKTVSSVREKEIMYNKIAEIDKVLRAEYNGEINEDTLRDYLAAGYIAGIGDKNAMYYTVKQYAEWQEIQSGKIVGIGVDFAKDASGYARIIRVYPNSPAAEVGITTDYYLLKINAADVKTLTTEQINLLIRGASGTSVEVTVRNRITSEEQTIVIQRRQYDTPTVFSNVINNEIGYLKILRFNENTAKEIREQSDKLLAQQSVKAMFIDLRNNPGGPIGDVLNAIDEVVPAGAIASQKMKDDTFKLLKTSDSEEIPVPIIVLTNGATVGGAELFAASIRDFSKGLIVGTKTAGKGSLQSDPIPLSDGSAVSFTIGTLLTKKGESFDGVGVTPDVEVLLNPDLEAIFYDLTPEKDPQILKALEAVQQLVQINGDTSTQGEVPASDEPVQQEQLPEPSAEAPAEPPVSATENIT